MHRSILILDNFLPDPDAFRDIAARMEFKYLNKKTNFPGRNSTQRLNIPDIDVSIENILQESLTPMTGLSHGKFRLTLATDEGLAKVHLDNSQWSGILYLTPDEYSSGGTEFFRHKPTGLDSALLSLANMKAQKWNSSQIANDAINNIVKSDSNNPEKWEHLMTVPMKYNRLLLMRPWLWHTAGPAFGKNFETGRLVFLLFYKSSQKPNSLL